ncbi:hypothetical protein QWT69_09650 [Sporosarcina oncorhynchi]|uniref:Sporulation integral membrane protein YlbJ n=1 Tax=Sporosarcina oncorhynchi TaxID=3056444 RepID=A0ABZ0L0T2_9BACL|nr:hypothetical protein [Sporosarcina sp. T2O-4]WOV86212.1 hypothetical protein QWT69_09650 [Sporosarcina sp. T2O-4]
MIDYPQQKSASIDSMISIAIIWGLIFLFILQPGIAHDGAEAGAQLFVHALLPYLLPYIILTQWLLKIPSSGKTTRNWKRFLKAYILGSFGGFPVGAVTVSEMLKNGELTRRESGYLLAACHAPGPMFIIGFVGTELLGDVSVGWKLLASIHIANLLFFLFALFSLTNNGNKDENRAVLTNLKLNSSPFLDSIKESSSVIILVATTVIFFSSVGNVLTSVITSAFTIDLGITKTVLLAIFEMTSGVQSAADHFFTHPVFPYMIAAIISLNGLSIHMQVFVIGKSANVPMIPYVFSRAFSVVAVPAILYVLL